jgi:hypothetical protein
MIKVERLGGIEVNVAEAVSYLVEHALFVQDNDDQGRFRLEVCKENNGLRVTVDYKRIESNIEKGLVPIGENCVFNESYTDKQFTFEQLIKDLHEQHLEAVENWLIYFLQEKFTLDGKTLYAHEVELNYEKFGTWEPITFEATLELMYSEDSGWTVTGAYAEEDVPEWDLKKGDSFDPGDGIDVDELLRLYRHDFEIKE